MNSYGFCNLGICLYIDDAVKTVLHTAQRLGLESRVVELKTSEEVRNLAPSPYGVFSIVYNGKLLSHHYLLEKELLKRLQAEVSPFSSPHRSLDR